MVGGDDGLSVQFGPDTDVERPRSRFFRGGAVRCAARQIVVNGRFEVPAEFRERVGLVYDKAADEEYLTAEAISVGINLDGTGVAFVI